MEPDNLLCSRNARSRTPLARANGASRRARGWVGEKVPRRAHRGTTSRSEASASEGDLPIQPAPSLDCPFPRLL